MIRNLLSTALTLYSFAIIAWIILSWIPISAGHPLARVGSLLDRIIYPVIAPIRRFIPPLRFGRGAIDLSPIILLVGIRLLRGLI